LTWSEGQHSDEHVLSISIIIYYNLLVLLST